MTLTGYASHKRHTIRGVFTGLVTRVSLVAQVLVLVQGCAARNPETLRQELHRIPLCTSITRVTSVTQEQFLGESRDAYVTLTWPPRHDLEQLAGASSDARRPAPSLTSAFRPAFTGLHRRILGRAFRCLERPAALNLHPEYRSLFLGPAAASAPARTAGFGTTCSRQVEPRLRMRCSVRVPVKPASTAPTRQSCEAMDLK